MRPVRALAYVAMVVATDVGVVASAEVDEASGSSVEVEGGVVFAMAAVIAAVVPPADEPHAASPSVSPTISVVFIDGRFAGLAAACVAVRPIAALFVLGGALVGMDPLDLQADVTA